jgi:hypothetical protein
MAGKQNWGGLNLYGPRGYTAHRLQFLEGFMAGHSQYKNIMHRKGRQDKLLSNAFAKLGREITVATKAGLPDPAMNARLRLAVQNARAGNMPWDTLSGPSRGSGADGRISIRALRGGRRCHRGGSSQHRNRTAMCGPVHQYGGNGDRFGERMFLRVGEISIRWPRAAPMRFLRRR